MQLFPCRSKYLRAERFRLQRSTPTTVDRRSTCASKASITSRASPATHPATSTSTPRVLGLRMVKKTVNQDDPTVYHLFYADEHGQPRRRHHLLRVPGRPPRPRRRGHGAHDHVPGRLGGRARLLGGPARRPRASPPTRATGPARLRRPGRARARARGRRDAADAPLVARHPEIPAELALQGFDGVRAFAADPEREPGAARGDARLRARRRRRAGRRAAPSAAGCYAYDPPPASGRRHPGSGHGASRRVGLEHGRAGRLARPRARAPARHPSGVIDRFWFRSIYFREPSGVLFEIATLGPGLHDRRGRRPPRRGADPAARVRAPTGPDRARR